MKNKKLRVVALLLGLTLLLTALPIHAGAAGRFTDVPADAWYAPAVEDAASRGIIQGVTPTTFNPNGLLTRAEFTTMLARLALSESELAQYRSAVKFSDVPASHWASGYINWAASAGVVNGVGGGKFAPGRQLSRQDMAVMMVNYARAMNIELPATRDPLPFQDYASISDYAGASVDTCVRAGVMQGSGANFLPRNSTRRSEAAQVFSNFMSLGRQADYTIIRKTVNGTAVSAVEFDPAGYTPDVVMGSDRVRGAESIQSIIRRTGARIAVNGGFFDLSSYDPYGTIVKNGELVTTFNLFSPQKSAIVMDSWGQFSVENFTTLITLTAYNYDEDEPEKAEQVALNRTPGTQDGTRVIFTRDWGSELGFEAKYAAAVDEEGFVTDVYRDQDVTIPAQGYLVVQRANRTNNKFMESLQVGSYIDREVVYENSRTQDIQLCLAVGPKLVENGAVYGNSGTYADEGLSGINNLENEYRACFGIKWDGTLVILTANTSLPKLSEIMVSMGCQSAVNMDGGGSTNLYAGGSYLAGPRDRLLNNVLIFK